MSQHKALIQDLLHAKRSKVVDNLARAEVHFNTLTAEQMQAPYGFSKKTPTQILAEYVKRFEEIQAAIDWLEGVPDGR